MNAVTLIGRLCANPELKYTPSGTATTRFTIAVDRGLSKEKKAEMESKGQPVVDFIPIVVWGKQAEHCTNYLSKGRLVAVQGSIQTGSYEKDGQRIYTTDVIAREVKFIEWGENKSKPQAQEPPMDPRFESAKDDPFPF